MTASKYYRRPFVIEAWPVTVDDLEDIARWCNGRVKGYSITFPKIRDKNRTLESQDRRSYAVLGNVIIKTNKGFIVMDGEDFASKYAAMKEAKEDERTIPTVG